MRKLRYLIVLLVLIFCCAIADAQQTPFERSQQRETATYDEIIQWYQQLSRHYPQIKLINGGPTDSEDSLQVVLLSADRQFDPATWHRQHKTVILINNGIHPGEPDGIDASMMLARDWLTGKIKLPSNVAIAIISVYNTGGCRNRNSYTRANQNGPIAYGFRGNAQNLDLNRDFIKQDAREARSFSRLFHWLQPDMQIDTHVSDGADFQHVMTLISTQYDQLGEPLGSWLKHQLLPDIVRRMQQTNWDIIPYVDFELSDFDKGMQMFFDTPRYSSGYASLFGCLSFIPETHMLKPFGQRVTATYDLLKSFVQLASEKNDSIRQLRTAWMAARSADSLYTIRWKPDSSRFSEIRFSGYETVQRISEATQLPMMYYDHGKPYTKTVRFFDQYVPARQIRKPRYYVLPQGWPDVLERLQSNQVQWKRLQQDSSIRVESYHIDAYTSSAKPYEKHHRNTQVQVSVKQENKLFRKGDYLISLDQPASRYLMTALEPESDDGFFAWNLFDGILQPKEGYSDYRWDEIAAEQLKKDSLLAAKLVVKKKEDPGFAQNGSAILRFIYENSIYFEKAFRQYPVYRIP